jgi:hypothetical protein
LNLSVKDQNINSFKENNNSKEIDEKYEKNHKIPPLEMSRKSRCLFFLFILLINFCLNLENGTIPASTVEIQNDLSCEEKDLGLFGSLLFVGNIIGKDKYFKFYYHYFELKIIDPSRIFFLFN